MSASVDIVEISSLDREDAYEFAGSPNSKQVHASTISAESLHPRRMATWDPAAFAKEQLRTLVQRVFLPGWPKPSRQVVVSAADAHCDSARVCVSIVREMAAVLPGTVCALEADLHSPGMARMMRQSGMRGCATAPDGSIPIAPKLWLMQPDNVSGGPEIASYDLGLRRKMSELRQRFDYSLIHAPAACLAEAVLLGQMADGIILVIQAGSTHRAVAQKALEVLKSAKVQVLGSVLTDRSFPIPEKLYRKL